MYPPPPLCCNVLGGLSVGANFFLGGCCLPMQVGPCEGAPYTVQALSLTPDQTVTRTQVVDIRSVHANPKVCIGVTIGGRFARCACAVHKVWLLCAGLLLCAELPLRAALLLCAGLLLLLLLELGAEVSVGYTEVTLGKLSKR